MKSTKPTDLEDPHKNYNLPLQQSFKRPSSLQKPKTLAIQILTAIPKSPDKPVTTANRLMQKRQSIERKLEEMRKQKIEAELKEVQTKPKISTRSRKLAEKAELKIISSVKQREIPRESKTLCEDDMIELEQDIQMLEDCLNIKESRYQMKTFKDAKIQMFEKVSIDKPQVQTIVARVKEMGRKSEAGKSSKVVRRISNGKEKMENSAKAGKERVESVKAVSPQRKFIKNKSPVGAKQRSVSMEDLAGFQFCYRSLSPYQINLKRTIEN